MNDYQLSNRKMLKDVVVDITSKLGLNVSELSRAIGYGDGYLYHATKESVFNTNGDMRDEKLNSVLMKITSDDILNPVLYEKSRRFKLKGKLAQAALELETTEGEISQLVSGMLKGVKVSAVFLSDKVKISRFSRNGDITIQEFNMLSNLIDKVVRVEKEGKQAMLNRSDIVECKHPPVSTTSTSKVNSKNTHDWLDCDPFSEFSSETISNKHLEKNKEEKKPALLNPDQIAEKLKQQLGYSSALWVDGHLVLSGGAK